MDEDGPSADTAGSSAASVDFFRFRTQCLFIAERRSSDRHAAITLFTNRYIMKVNVITFCPVELSLRRNRRRLRVLTPELTTP